MRRSPEIVILIVLLVIMIVGVLWYVVDRRAKLPTAPASKAQAAAPTEPTPVLMGPAGPVEIPDGKTLDFSSGAAVVKDTPADQAVLAKVLKEMEEAARTVTFDTLPTPKKDPPDKVPPDKR